MGFRFSREGYREEGKFSSVLNLFDEFLIFLPFKFDFSSIGQCPTTLLRVTDILNFFFLFRIFDSTLESKKLEKMKLFRFGVSI